MKIYEERNEIENIDRNIYEDRCLIKNCMKIYEEEIERKNI